LSDSFVMILVGIEIEEVARVNCLNEQSTRRTRDERSA